MKKNKKRADNSLKSKYSILHNKIVNTVFAEELKSESSNFLSLLEKREANLKSFDRLIVLFLGIFSIVASYTLYLKSDNDNDNNQVHTTYTYSNHIDSTGNKIDMNSSEFIQFLFTKIDTLQNEVIEGHRDLIKEKERSISILNDNYRYLSFIELVEKSLDMKFIYETHDNSATFRFESPKVDSAFMLLDVYRDKIRYDQDKKKWYVTR